MELVTLAKEMLQSAAEHAASYRFGQSILRYMDRTLWVVEKCARWAVPPPLEDDHPQPELIRPLPWVFFLMMLVTLRVTRETISLVNLALGKPPLRSADVVIYIQSKRRYLRTLKYQGNRIIRARSTQSQPHHSWYSSIQSLFEFTMCFRRPQNYGNNNTSLSNNHEVLVVKRSKRGRETTSPGASVSANETTMERLIEKMMVDLADDSDDSSFTLTNVTSVKSDRSDYTAESDQENFNDVSTPNKNMPNEVPQNNDHSPNKAVVEEIKSPEKIVVEKQVEENVETDVEAKKEQAKNDKQVKPEISEDAALWQTTEIRREITSTKQESSTLIANEKSPKSQAPKIDQKIGNGRMPKYTHAKRKDVRSEKRALDMQ